MKSKEEAAVFIFSLAFWGRVSSVWGSDVDKELDDAFHNHLSRSCLTHGKTNEVSNQFRTQI